METSIKSIPTFTEGVRDCIPTLLGYIGIGISMGIVGKTAHLSIVEIGLLSAFVYAGASQFVICAMLITMSPPSAIIATTFIVNFRHFMMSAALAPHFSAYSLLKNVGIGTLLTDESFGVATHRVSRGLAVNDRWMNGLNVMAYLTWIASSMAGGWLGSWIPDPKMFGLDFALTAMFVALLVQQLHAMPASKLKHYLSLIVYMVITMFVLSIFFSTYMAVLLGTVIIATIGMVTER
ncbi:4-azaleucine resistance probable transporter AzlC [Paenibacillus sp. yr247]|uniref:AzlC family ABC transporter permease n=1 Tax=Paenibacillus sp. yr247 TaxID=1761880 RepID=UPI00088EFDEA|nr:AzlC family ABC transporter permease [Paenibacillus sp. yr247]SDN67139.1 4-azaleucine resistance probable transporter AzlC [Paenibacillus sp. yr247]